MHESCIQRAQSTAILTELNSEIELELEIETIETEHNESDSGTFQEELEPLPPVHVLALWKRKTIQFSAFSEIEQIWENSSKKINLMHTIEAFRDAVMIVIDQNIMMFNMQNGIISHAHNLTLSTGTVEPITLPNDVECAKLALFCLLNDKIYCFSRSDQQFYHK